MSGAAGAGGLVGSNTSGAISTSFATGSVNGAAGTGGLIGSNTSGAINNSYATGNVNGGTGAGVGGLIGSNTSGTVMNSYAAGGVSGTGASRGALIGSSNANVVSNSYWNTDTANQTVSPGGGIGMTTADMMIQANFTLATDANSPDNPAWDFANTWAMYENITYPLLSDFMTPLTVTANNDLKTYDGLSYSGGNGVTYSELVNGIAPAGTLSYSGTSQGAINANSYVITPGGLQPDQHYLITFIDGTLTVSAKTVTLSASKTYDGTTSLTDAVTVGTGIDGEALTYTGATASDAHVATGGKYIDAITLTDNGAVLASNYGLPTLDVGNAPVTISVATLTPTLTNVGVTKTYDSTIDAPTGFSPTYSFTGLASGDTDATLANTGSVYNDKDVSDADTVTVNGLSITGITGANSSAATDYALDAASKDVAATITAKTVTISNLMASDKVYDATADAAMTGTPTLTGILLTDVVTVSGTANTGTFDLGKDVGTELPVTANLGGLTLGSKDADNYQITTVTTPLTADITPAALTVAANPLSKVYGTSDPALTYTASGFQLDDTAGSILSGALARAAGENVGSYLIGKNTLTSNANYTVAYTGVDLDITPAALNVAADAKSKVYGTSDPTLTFDTTGLVNNPALGIADTADSVLSGALTRVPGESALGGPYAITQGTLAANSNYALGFTDNNLIIIGAAAEPVLGFNAGQVVFAGVINNEFYYRSGNFWHISLNPNNADPGFDVMRGTNDLNSRLRRSLNPCDSVFGGGFCETWSFPQQREKVDEK